MTGQWRRLGLYKTRLGEEDLKTLNETVKVVNNRHEANIALATRLGGRKNFAVLAGSVGTGKDATVLEHFEKKARILVLCPPHMVNVWNGVYAHDADRHVHAVSYYRLAHHLDERVSLILIDEHDELIIDSAHGARACNVLGQLVKKSEQRTVYVGSTINDPVTAVHWARTCLNRERDDFSWVVVPKGPIYR